MENANKENNNKSIVNSDRTGLKKPGRLKDFLNFEDI